jgi:putative ABC transport system substrate-binding protein
VQAHAFATSSPASLDGAFEAAISWGAEALLTTSTLNITFDGRLIPQLAVKNRLPAISDELAFTNRGGLMSYAADGAELFRRAAAQIGQILQGASPGDVPMEQPTKFVFSVNVTTAKDLGLTISDDLASHVTNWVS